MTNIKEIHCIDINWIDERIKYLSDLFDKDNHTFTSGQLIMLQVLKDNLKPIQPLIVDAFNEGIIFGPNNSDSNYVKARNNYVNTKQFEL